MIDIFTKINSQVYIMAVHLSKNFDILQDCDFRNLATFYHATFYS